MSDNLLSSPGESKTIYYTDHLLRRQQLVRTFETFNPEFALKPRTNYLHHLAEDTDYFRDFIEALSEYLSKLTTDRVVPGHILKSTYDFIDTYSYEAQIRNMSQRLNHDPDYFLIPLMFDNEFQAAEWRKYDAASIFFTHRYRVSKYVYEFIFSRIWRHGGVYLEIYYPGSDSTLNELSNKAVRLVDNSQVVDEFLPPNSEFWPRPGFLTGADSYSEFLRLFAFRYDTANRDHDEGIVFTDVINEDIGPDPPLTLYDYDVDVDPLLNFDGDIVPFIRDRTLVLSMTLDRVLRLTENALRTEPNDCLQDIPFLQYTERRARANKKITERLKIGSQLTIACDTSGFFVKGAGATHSMPDIAADVSVIRQNYDANNEPAYIRLGTGQVTGQLRTLIFRRPGDFQKAAVYGEVSAYDESYYNSGEAYQSEGSNGGPENGNGTGLDVADFDMVNPIFGTVLGEFEAYPLNSQVTSINTMVEKQTLNGMSSLFTLTSPEDTGAEDNLNAVTFPHNYVTPGTFVGILDMHTFYIRIAADILNPTFNSESFNQRTIPLTDFLFDTDFTSSEFDILPEMLYDTRQLRYFGAAASSPNTPPVDPNDGWAELHPLLLESGPTRFMWAYDSLVNPNLETSLRDFVAALDPDVDDIQAEVETAFFEGESSTALIEWVQEWIESESILVRFYPVDDYDVSGVAPEIPEDEYLSDGKINWTGSSWNYKGWYKYASQYLWRVYIRIIEILSTAGGWQPKIEYMVFNDFAFREALRFFDVEVTRTTQPTDFPILQRNEILQEFFLSLGNGGIYATTSPDVIDKDREDLLSFLQPPQDGSFFNPTYVGAASLIPEIVVHNYFRIDPSEVIHFTDRNGEPQSVEGVRLDRESGVLQFALMTPPVELDKYKEPSVSSNTIEERAPVETALANMNLTYVVNTTKNFADPLDITTQIVGIREAGIYNTEGLLIAYANFPPIIYDSFVNHLAVNWYISSLEFTSP